MLVNGASGTVGTAAVQLAKHLGATVVGVCSAGHAPLVASLGADRVIDYASEDFAAARGAYDVIFDAVGTRTFGQCRAALTEHGIYLDDGSDRPRSCCRRRSRSCSAGAAARRSRSPGCAPRRTRPAELPLLVDLLESGAMVPVIDRVVPFADIVEAHRRVDAGHKAGSVVVALSPALRPTEAAS